MTTKSVTPEGDATPPNEHCSTTEAAKRLGLAVRSVQLMVDRGELQAWRTPGGHRRITRDSIQRALQAQGMALQPAPQAGTSAPAAPQMTGRPMSVLLIEDSAHYQNLVGLLLRQKFPDVQLRVANDGIIGLVMYGEHKPDVLIVDILLPGIDGATLITSLRMTRQFSGAELIVMTSLSEAEREPYAMALDGLPVVHKSKLIQTLPGLIAQQQARQP
jgi:excisionase family DNA binding protein